MSRARRGKPAGEHSLLSEGRCPSDSPTRVFARRFAGSLRSRGSLAALAREVHMTVGVLPTRGETRARRVQAMQMRRPFTSEHVAEAPQITFLVSCFHPVLRF